MPDGVLLRTLLAFVVLGVVTSKTTVAQELHYDRAQVTTFCSEASMFPQRTVDSRKPNHAVAGAVIGFAIGAVGFIYLSRGGLSDADFERTMGVALLGGVAGAVIGALVGGSIMKETDGGDHNRKVTLTGCPDVPIPPTPRRLGLHALQPWFGLPDIGMPGQE